jgi:hypothetical protein
VLARPAWLGTIDGVADPGLSVSREAFAGDRFYVAVVVGDGVSSGCDLRELGFLLPVGDCPLALDKSQTWHHRAAL